MWKFKIGQRVVICRYCPSEMFKELLNELINYIYSKVRGLKLNAADCFVNTFYGTPFLES